MSYHPDFDPARKDKNEGDEGGLRDKLIPNVRYAFLFLGLNILLFVGFSLGLLPSEVSIVDLFALVFLLTIGAATVGFLGSKRKRDDEH